MDLIRIVEAALFASGRPLSIADLQGLFEPDRQPEVSAVRAALAVLAVDYAERPIELKEVASGFRFQVREGYSPWLSRLFEERPGRYSKAFLETLAIIAYRQPVTRGEIEDIRGVAVSSNIIRTLLDREWVHVVGHKEVPGRPALFATTRQFLDYFNLTGLDALPPLQEFLDQLGPEPEAPTPPGHIQDHAQDSPPITLESAQADDADAVDPERTEASEGAEAGPTPQPDETAESGDEPDPAGP